MVPTLRRVVSAPRAAIRSRGRSLATASSDMPSDHAADEALVRRVIGAFYEVYNTLGFGFLEHIYMMALERELLARGHRVARQVSVRVSYKGEALAQQRVDMIVDERLIVEVKSTYDLHKAAPRQVFNYLRATNMEVGLLLHFGPTPSFFRLISSNNRSALPAESAASG